MSQESDAVMASRRRSALEYLHRSLDRARAFAVLLSPNAETLNGVAHEFLERARVEHRVRFSSATTDLHGFLKTMLGQLGFEAFAASTDDLRALVTMFLRHESAEGRYTLIALEQAQNFGPHVLELVRDLAQVRGPRGSAATFLLTGTPALGHVLDSPGWEVVADLSRERFDLESARAEAPSDDPAPVLFVSRDGKALGHFRVLDERVLIGRHRDNDLTINSAYVSRHHAMLVGGETHPVLFDLKSTNGTYVNAEAITQRPLRHGDVVSIGDLRIEFINPTHRRVELPKGDAQLDETGQLPTLRGIDMSDDDEADVTRLSNQLAG